MMHPVKVINVRAQPRPYPVLIGPGVLRKTGAELGRIWNRNTRFFIVTNPDVWSHWGGQLSESLSRAKLEFELLELEAGEQHKNLDSIEKLAERLARLQADRSSVLIAFGGGVVGDVTGFLAAIYMRGVPVVQIPTTLLAQVDAAIGGKTGVNLPAGKNLVGSFHQPRAVFIDPLVVTSLSPRQFKSGLFEVLKCGIIRSAKLFSLLEKSRTAILEKDPKVLTRIIEESVSIKARVVEADEKEKDLRRILNFGHTLGHALESLTAYQQFLHGEAVAWGMIGASEIARQINLLKKETSEHIQELITSYGPLPAVGAETSEVMAAILRDKKTLHGVPHLVLPTKIGAVKLVKDVSEKAIIAGIEHIKSVSAGRQ